MCLLTLVFSFVCLLVYGICFSSYLIYNISDIDTLL